MTTNTLMAMVSIKFSIPVATFAVGSTAVVNNTQRGIAQNGIAGISEVRKTRDSHKY